MALTSNPKYSHLPECVYWLPSIWREQPAISVGRWCWKFSTSPPKNSRDQYFQINFFKSSHLFANTYKIDIKDSQILKKNNVRNIYQTGFFTPLSYSGIEFSSATAPGGTRRQTIIVIPQILHHYLRS